MNPIFKTTSFLPTLHYQHQDILIPLVSVTVWPEGPLRSGYINNYLLEGTKWSFRELELNMPPSTRVTVWPEGPLRSRYINFLEKETDLPVFSDELCRRILPRALSDWHTLHNPAGGCILSSLLAYTMVVALSSQVSQHISSSAIRFLKKV